MGRSYTYVNFDAHETGVRDGKFWEDKLDPKGLLVHLLIHPEVIKKIDIPEEWLPKSSEGQRRTLGSFRTVPLEVINAILTLVTDYISVACFGATHPLLVHPAFERMRDISCTMHGTCQWASNRITLIEKYWANPDLPAYILTEDEKREMAELAKTKEEHALWYGWPDLEENYTAPNHGDELRARKENAYYSSHVARADMRWKSAYAGKPLQERQTTDFKRVLKFLRLVEEQPFLTIHAGKYVLCNQTKREYVSVEDVARFVRRGLDGADMEITGPFISSASRWGLGDTAGFLVMWDGDNDCGVGVGPWVGDRICITTVKHMETMNGAEGEDSQAWSNIGGRGSDLWKRINDVMGNGGGPRWMRTY